MRIPTEPIGSIPRPLELLAVKQAVKIDPSGGLLGSFIDLNNLALARFASEERALLGVHTCPGGDRDSTHSADVNYADLLPCLFQLNVGSFYIALAGEPDRVRVLEMIREHLQPGHRVCPRRGKPPLQKSVRAFRARPWRNRCWGCVSERR